MSRAGFFWLVMIAAAGSALVGAAAPAEDAPPATPPATPPAAVRTVAPDAAGAILGGVIVDRSDKEIGHLVDVLVDAGGVPQAGIIDFGGFLGVGARKVAVHWSTLHFSPGDAKHQIVLDMTPDEIKAAPAYRDPDKPAPVVTPAAVIPVAGTTGNPAQAEPSPH